MADGSADENGEGSGSKNSQTRFVPLTTEAHDILSYWRKQNEGTSLVFTSLKT